MNQATRLPAGSALSPPENNPAAGGGMKRPLLFIMFRALWFLICAGMVALFLREIAEVKNHPEAYASLWGGEGPVAGLWYYFSETVYLLHAAALACWFLAGMIASLGRGRFRSAAPLVVHSALSGLWFAFSARF